MDVVALVGASGTGKSHRASMVAHECEADLIIDDGLLIKDSKIIAGKSAKREDTMIKAVKRAVFSDPQDAAEIKAKIRELKPRRVLVLGTSRTMVHRIVDALDIPRPSRYLSINDVASRDEIQRALRIRRLYGKHVIPAPTFEVKRSFSGYLIDPLRVRFFRRERSERRDDGFLVEKSIVRPTFSCFGKFYIADTVVSSITARVSRQVEGITRVGRVRVDTKPEGVHIFVEVNVRYGDCLLEPMRRVQVRVKEAVEYMTALNVLSVSVIATKLSIVQAKSREEGEGE